MRLARLLALSVAAAAVVAGCSSKDAPPTAATPPGSASAGGPAGSGGTAGTAGTAGSGTAGSAGSAYQALGKKPANARRPTAPPDIEAKALAVGAKAPLFEVKDVAGAPWRLADALSKHAKVILVFYRGDW